MLMRRRPLARAAMLGGAGYMAYRAGRGAQQQQYHEAEQDAQLQAFQQQPPAASPPYQPATAPPVAAQAAPADTAASRIDALTKLKGLLDAG
ncbi:MAG: SHOCT domain-containing protein, partial [Candidatus Dormibacteraeota bacterium]|nr:SHOCT domain-containing protein [Candidatus Dormibacteraeota bacterium]